MKIAFIGFNDRNLQEDVAVDGSKSQLNSRITRVIN